MNTVEKRTIEAIHRLALEKELARRNLVDFMEYKFRYYHLRPFKRNWHHDYVAEALKGCLAGELRRVIIEIAPSYGKTEQVVRSFVSHTLGNNPRFKFIYTSYGGDLTEKVSVETRDWMKSKVYQGIFNVKISKSAEQKTDWGTEEGGGLYATTVGGAITGRHAHGIIIDDPMKASEAYSRASREIVKSYFHDSILSRMEEWEDSKAFIVLIMQRLHPDDLVGHLLREQGGLWTRLHLPAVLPHKTVYELGGFRYEREAEEPLFPAKHNRERLRELEREMGDAAYKTQMLQDPEISEAGFFEDEWIGEIGVAELPQQSLYIMVDPAMSTKETADDRGIVVVGWSVDKDGIERVCMMDCWSGKWELDEFLDYIADAMIAYPEASVEIELAGGGHIVETELRKRVARRNAQRRGQGQDMIRNPINGTPPNNKIPKTQKIAAMQPYAQNGQIKTRRGAHGAEKFRAQMAAFSPEKKSNKDDLIDPFATSWQIANPKRERVTKQSEYLRRRKKTDGGWNI